MNLHEDILMQVIGSILEESGIEYRIETLTDDKLKYSISFIEDGNTFFTWHTWENSEGAALHTCFLQLFGEGLISKFPKHFQHKGE